MSMVCVTSAVRGFALALVALGVLSGSVIAPGVQASERPFTGVVTAVPEGDNDNNFSVETWYAQDRISKIVSSRIEYYFNPYWSAEVELGLSKERKGKGRGKEADIEVKHVFVDPARAGYGLGINISAGLGRETGQSKLEYEGSTLIIPLSVPVFEKSGTVHANAGLRYLTDTKTTKPVWALGYEHQLAKNVVGYLEAGGRVSTNHYVGAGIRYWVKKERFGIDFTTGNGKTKTGGAAWPAAEAFVGRYFTVGITVQDISF